METFLQAINAFKEILEHVSLWSTLLRDGIWRQTLLVWGSGGL